MNCLGVTPVQDAPTLKVVTACSGSGAPSLVLNQLVGGSGGFSEVMACEIDPAAAHAMMVNARPLHAHADVHLPTGHTGEMLLLYTQPVLPSPHSKECHRRLLGWVALQCQFFAQLPSI